MPNFFIDRPIFAWVIAIIIMLAGGLAILKLPVAQYPTIAPPAVTVSATYPGADAKTVQDTVTQVIEQNMNASRSCRYLGVRRVKTVSKACMLSVRRCLNVLRPCRLTFRKRNVCIRPLAALSAAI
jgi:multidrug efflux pump subunit AcrB